LPYFIILCNFVSYNLFIAAYAAMHAATGDYGAFKHLFLLSGLRKRALMALNNQNAWSGNAAHPVESLIFQSCHPFSTMPIMMHGISACRQSS
jgi:hypothetical protein